MSKLNTLYIKSLRSKYRSGMDEALANLSLYLSNGNLAAIGEHSDLLTEQDRWVESYANSKDKLESLEEMLKTLE
jgi:hypothetical protein